MRLSCLATLLTLATMGLAGCGENATTTATNHDASARVPFEIAGKWLFLGPSEGLHNLTITDTSLEYTDVDGKWSSTWNIKSYDNSLHHFQMAFGSGSGTYLPEGQTLSGTYVVDAQIMSLQLASGTASYPSLRSPDSCTESDSTPIPDCRLYMKQP